MRHFVVVAILVIALSTLTYSGLMAANLLPAQASEQALPVDWLFNLQFITISFLFSLIVVPLLYSLIVFRRKKGESGDGVHIEGNTPLEITWTAIPLVIVMGFAYLGAYSLGETRRIDPQAMVVNVTAQQFAWTFEYPETGVVSDVLYLPKDKQVLLKMTSRDVIHSFWVPEFRIKQDILPGRTTEYRITPTLEGDYRLRCAELCGSNHAYMLANVKVVSRADFDAWMAARAEEARAAADTPEGRGKTLVTQNGCLGCHSLDGSRGTGPTWLGLYGSSVPLSDGSTVTADDAFIKESILQPQAKYVAGYETIQMPVYTFTDEQIADIIAFIETLK